MSAHLRSVVRAALAATVLAISLVAFSATTVPARADVTTTALSRARAYAVAAYRMRMRVWHFAMRQHGKPYIWGGTGPSGFDCSGLVYAAYRAAGIRLPRTTYEMLASWRLVRIPKWRARRGDLAFFGTGHVELYEWGRWTYGAADYGTSIGFHAMNPWWHPTMYFRVRM
jgi:NlpC/P60 family